MKKVISIFLLLCIVAISNTLIAKSNDEKGSGLTEFYELPYSFKTDDNPTHSVGVNSMGNTDVVLERGGIDSYINNTYDNFLKFDSSKIATDFVDYSVGLTPTIGTSSISYDLTGLSTEEITNVRFRFENQFTNNNGDVYYDLEYDITNAKTDNTDSLSEIDQLLLTFSTTGSKLPSIGFYGIGDFEIEGNWTLYEHGTNRRATDIKLGMAHSDLEDDYLQTETVGILSTTANKVVMNPDLNMRHYDENGYDYMLSEDIASKVGAVADNTQIKTKYGVDALAGEESHCDYRYDFWNIYDIQKISIASTDTSIDVMQAPTNEKDLLEKLSVEAIDKETGEYIESNIRYLDEYDYNNPQTGVYTFEIEATNSSGDTGVTRSTLVLDKDLLHFNITGYDDVELEEGLSLEEIAQIANVQTLEILQNNSDSSVMNESNIVDTDNYIKEIDGIYYFLFEDYGNENNMKASKIIPINLNMFNKTTVVSNDLTIQKDSYYDPIKSHYDFEAYYYDANLKVNVYEEDGVILDIQNNVDIHSSGRYDVKYTITSPIDNSSDTTTVQVNVVDYNDGQAIINGENSQVDINEAPNTDSEIKSELKIIATEGDGTPIDTSNVKILDYDGYDMVNPQNGKYDIVFATVGSDGVMVTATYTLTIKPDDEYLMERHDAQVTQSSLPQSDEELITLFNPRLYSVVNDIYYDNAVFNITDYGGYIFGSNYNIGQIFTMELTAQDPNGIDVVKEVKLVVGQENIEVNIWANDNNKLKTQPTITNEELIDLTNAFLLEKINDEISNREDLEATSIINLFDLDSNTIGEYSIEIEATSKDNLQVNKFVKIDVVPVLEPTVNIEVNDMNLDQNAYYNPILSHQKLVATYTDELGNENILPNEYITYETTYTGEESVGESFTTFYTATSPIDSSIVAHYAANIKVVSANSLMIVNDNNENLATAPTTEEQIIALMVSSTIGRAIPNVAIVNYDGYDINSPAVGQYNIIFSYDDQEGNTITDEGTLTIQ